MERVAARMGPGRVESLASGSREAAVGLKTCPTVCPRLKGGPSSSARGPCMAMGLKPADSLWRCQGCGLRATAETVRTVHRLPAEGWSTDR